MGLPRFVAVCCMSGLTNIDAPAAPCDGAAHDPDSSSNPHDLKGAETDMTACAAMPAYCVWFDAAMVVCLLGEK